MHAWPLFKSLDIIVDCHGQCIQSACLIYCHCSSWSRSQINDAHLFDNFTPLYFLSFPNSLIYRTWPISGAKQSYEPTNNAALRHFTLTFTKCLRASGPKKSSFKRVAIHWPYIVVDFRLLVRRQSWGWDIKSRFPRWLGSILYRRWLH